MNTSSYNIKIQVPEPVSDIKDIFVANGLDLFLVGGCVRDSLLGQTPKDFDLATNATPNQIEKVLHNKYQTKETGKAFGVINVMTDAGTFEIATFRVDSENSDGRRPDSVVFSTIEEDVLRRDFTINALFYDLHKEVIVDLVGGVADLTENKIIKTVGSADLRFQEDRLRILRAIRFHAKLEYELDKCIEESIRSNNSLDNISRERVRDEFVKTLTVSKEPKVALLALERLGLMSEVFPGLETNNVFYNRGPIISHEVFIAMLLYKNHTEVLRKKLNKLCYTHQEIKNICFLVDLTAVGYNNIYELKKRQSATTLCKEEILYFCQSLFKEKIHVIEKFLDWELSIGGDSLKTEGFLEGKEIGDEIKRREMAIIEEKIGPTFFY